MNIYNNNDLFRNLGVKPVLIINLPAKFFDDFGYCNVASRIFSARLQCRYSYEFYEEEQDCPSYWLNIWPSMKIYDGGSKEFLEDYKRLTIGDKFHQWQDIRD